MKENNNPYKVICEELEEEGTASQKRTTRKGFDSQGHLVMINSNIETKEGVKIRHFESVGADGYWSGGTSLEFTDGTFISGQTANRKFEEEL